VGRDGEFSCTRGGIWIKMASFQGICSELS
jgi:hypothetical protein